MLSFSRTGSIVGLSAPVWLQTHRHGTFSYRSVSLAGRYFLLHCSLPGPLLSVLSPAELSILPQHIIALTTSSPLALGLE